MLSKINEAAAYLKSHFSQQPRVGIILGTGLGGLVNEINIEKAIPYEQIPHFPVSTVEGHCGKFIIGTIGNVPVVAMQGRFHFYEGYGMVQVTFPVRVMKVAGIDKLIVSNASGGLNPSFKVGDIMVITDHINMFGTNPLIGKNSEYFGPRFPDMSEAYSKRLRALAYEVAKKNNIELKEGVYVGTTGPSFETPAEYKMFRVLGADAVGMSTVPEVIVARHAGMEVFGVSIITNASNSNEAADHQDVQRVAGAAEPLMTKVIRDMVLTM